MLTFKDKFWPQLKVICCSILSRVISPHSNPENGKWRGEKKKKKNYTLQYVIWFTHQLKKKVSHFGFILPNSIRDATEKRRAESAGTFNVASEIVKPRISHTREPRLSKMQLLIEVSQTLYPSIRLDINTSHTFLHRTWCSWSPSSCRSSFLGPILPVITLPCFISTIMCDTSRQNWYTVILLLHLFHTGVQHMPSDLLGKKCKRKAINCQRSRYIKVKFMKPNLHFWQNRI